MNELRRSFVYLCILLLLSTLVICGVSAQKSLQISSETGTQGVEIFLTCNNSLNITGYNLEILYDSTVIEITEVNVIQSLGNFDYLIYGPGKLWVQDFTGGNGLPSGNQTILSFLVNNLTEADGSSTNIFVDATNANHEINERIAGVVTSDYALINGTFTLTDLKPPTIDFTYPGVGVNSIPLKGNITANITDLSGVNQGSIAVTVDGIPRGIVSYTPITIAGRTGFTIDVPYEFATQKNAVPIIITAKDNSPQQNQGTDTKTVDVVDQGVRITSPVDGSFTNNTQIPISASILGVTNPKMYLNNIEVTGSCDVTVGTITLNYTKWAQVLPEGTHEVVVNGTPSGPGIPAQDTVDFTVLTTAPTIAITSIADSDGDGYSEALETLTINYVAATPYFKKAWIDGVENLTDKIGILTYGKDQGNVWGNRQATVWVEDLAGNVGSTNFWIYNNYLAYINETKAGTFAGLDLNKSAVYNIFEKDVSKAIQIKNSRMMASPTIDYMNKTVVGGSGVVVDNRANDTIQKDAINEGVPYFIVTEGGTFHFDITVPHIHKAALIIGMANSTMIDQILGGTKPSASTIEEMLSKDKIVMYAPAGYQGIKIDAQGDPVEIPGFSAGTFNFTVSDLKKTIQDNYINLSSGFTTQLISPGIGIGPGGNQFGPGEYVLLAMCLDGPDDRVSVITAMPFVVTEQASQFTTSAATYPIGDPVVVNWGGVQPQNIAGILIREGSTYTGNVTIDLTSLGASSLESMYLLGDGNQTVKKLIDRANIYISEGYGNAHNATNNNNLSIPTTGLIPGSYTVHMMVENGGNLTSYGDATVTLVDATTLTAEFTGTPIAGTNQITTQFTDQSTGGTAPYTYHWQYNRNNAGWVDFTTPNAQNPTQVFGVGAYSIRLTVTDAASTTATETKANYINVAQSGGGGGGGGGGSGVLPAQESVGSASLLTNSLGQLLQSYIVDSPSKVATLYLNRNIIALDKDGNPLSSVSMDDLPAGNVPAVPGGSVFSFAGHAVTCSPAGATFSPNAQLNFEFTQAQWDALMAQAEQDPSILSVKWYNSETGLWENVQTTVNPATRTVAARIAHFSIFALFTDPEAAIPVVTPTVPPMTPVTPTEPAPPATPVTPVEPTGFPWTYVIIGVIIIILIAGGAYYYSTKQS